MKTNVYILNSSGKFTRIQSNLRNLIHATVEMARQRICIGNIDIVVKESLNPASLKDMHGVGGFCPSKHRVELTIDLNHPSVKKELSRVVRGSLLHELHHTARFRANVSFDERLIDIMATEGLADQFVKEILGKQNIWTTTVKGKKLDNLILRARKEFLSKAYSYEDWFIIGSKQRNIPRWSGYAIAYTLVGEYMEKTGKSAVDLLSTKSNDILKQL